MNHLIVCNKYQNMKTIKTIFCQNDLKQGITEPEKDQHLKILNYLNHCSITKMNSVWWFIPTIPH